MRAPILVVLSLLAGTAAAQEPARPTGVCMDAEPRPACRSFVITEAHFNGRLAPDPGNGACCPRILHQSYLTAELAFMRNVGPDVALGIGVFGGREFAVEANQFGLRARYRRWLTSRQALDLSLGMVYTSAGYGTFDSHLGGTVQAGFQLAPWLTVSGGVDYVPGLEFDGAFYIPAVTPSFYLGFSLAGGPARAAWMVTAAGGALAAAWGN
jgi:hypothetical protein